MKRHLALVFLATSGVAHAALINSSIIKPPLEPTCPSATLAYCQAKAWQGTSCAATNKPLCDTVLTTEFARQYDAMSTNATLIPPSGVATPGMAVGGKVVPFNRDGLYGITSDFNYWTANQVFSPLPRHAGYDGNGAKVEDCLEFVYEKYFDYSRFEDAVAACKGDALCITKVAANPGLPGLNRATLHKRNGTDMPVQLRIFSGMSFDPLLGNKKDRAKNVFFQPGYGPSKFWNIVAARAGTTNLTGLVDVAPYTVTDKWAWHMTMYTNNTIEGLTSADYDDVARRTTRYAALIDAYRAEAINWPAESQAVLTNYIPMGCTSVPLPDGTCSTTMKPLVNTYIVGQLRAMANQIADAILAEWTHVNPRQPGVVDHGCLTATSARCDWNPKEFVADYVGRFHNERNADYRRCVVDTGGVNGIDGRKFSTLPAATLSSLQLTVSPTTFSPVYYDTYDSDRLDAWMTRREAAVAAATRDLRRLGSDAVSSTVGDSTSAGNSIYFNGGTSFLTANAGYGYDASWQMRLVNAGTGNLAICRAEGEAKAHVNAHIGVGPVGDTEIVDGAIDLVASQADPTGHLTAHLRILNDEQFVPLTDQRLDYSFPLVSKSTPLFGAQQTIYVLGVPATVAVAVQANYGVDLTASAAAAGCNASAPSFRLSGTFDPYVGIAGAASVAIGGDFGIIGAELGVEGTLDFVTLSLPFTTSLSLSSTAVTLNMASNVTLRSLDGDLKAFAEVCILGDCSRVAQQNLFSWEGVSTTQAMFPPLQKSIDVGILNTWVAQGGGTAVGSSFFSADAL